MARLGLEKTIVDQEVADRTAARFARDGIVLPTFAQLARPETIPESFRAGLASIGPDDAHPLNLFRVHWHNGPDRKALVPVPVHSVWTEEITGVPAPILVAHGDRFPMITAHKVLAAYGCLVPRLVTGQLDPEVHRAIWPSTGNYCRGGVAISRILGCRSAAVLPAGMSEERFRWLERWVSDPGDIIRTPGSESNVKEIYDKCAELDKDPQNILFNQFCEFGNHLVHYTVTGPALETVFRANAAGHPEWSLAAFVSATGSAGTIGAGDYLKEIHGTRIVAAEALECPTMLKNGFGEHNIQGIGDKHIPYIHNVMNTDAVAAISDRSTDTLDILFQTDVGRAHLIEDRGWPEPFVRGLAHYGYSAICNVLAAIKFAKAEGLGKNDVVVTVATDGADLYASELDKTMEKRFSGKFDRDAAARTLDEEFLGTGIENLLVLTPMDRDRIFNLGYFTWVEQQGVELADFEARRSQDFWRGLRELVPAWDRLVDEFNGAKAPDARTGP